MLLKKEHSSVLRRCNQSRTDEHGMVRRNKMILSFLTLHSRRFSAYTKRTKRLLTPLAKKVRKFSCMKISTFIPQLTLKEKLKIDLMDVFNIA